MIKYFSCLLLKIRSISFPPIISRWAKTNSLYFEEKNSIINVGSIQKLRFFQMIQNNFQVNKCTIGICNCNWRSCDVIRGHKQFFVCNNIELKQLKGSQTSAKWLFPSIRIDWRVTCPLKQTCASAKNQDPRSTGSHAIARFQDPGSPFIPH